VGNNEGVAEWDLVRKAKRYVPTGGGTKKNVHYHLGCNMYAGSGGDGSGSDGAGSEADAEVLATFWLGNNEGVAEWDLVRKAKRYVPTGGKKVHYHIGCNMGEADAEVLATFWLGNNEVVAEWDLVRKVKRYVLTGGVNVHSSGNINSGDGSGDGSEGDIAESEGDGAGSEAEAEVLVTFWVGTD
jgi:hypothetical protein